jgi:hypothetical protein
MLDPKFRDAYSINASVITVVFFFWRVVLFWNACRMCSSVSNGRINDELERLINTGFLDFVHRPEFYN